MIARLLTCACMAAAALAAPADAAEQEFQLAIVRGVLPPAQRVLRVHEGDQVRLAWRSDRRLTLHLHGYDIEWRVRPGDVVQSSFTAYASGRFPIEIHGSDDGHGTPLAVFEVYPK
ncbi:MAG: hypothetical protein ACHQAY_08140 [Hyphomicrobiales bacterium]